MAFESYRDLLVWQKAMDVVVACYELSRRFPDDERFGLTSQLRRAAVSIPSNIAEGHGRGTPKSFSNHLWIANGSLKELETQLLIVRRLEFAPADRINEVLDALNEVGRMLTALRRSLKDPHAAS